MKKYRAHESGNVLGYLKTYGDIPLGREPFNEIDALILCQLAYLKFDCVVPGVRENKRSVELSALSRREDADRLFAGILYERENRELFERLLASKRYEHLKLNCYVNLVRKEAESQFSAVTFLMDAGYVFVAFRGTDETLAGWKENLNMIFLDPTPAQVFSVKYLNCVSRRFPGRFFVGGHSKGGNLAVYASAGCRPSVQERIAKIFCMDGPGIRREIAESAAYARIGDKVEKYLTQASPVGGVFQWDDRFEVIDSKGLGVAQHNPFLWKVQRTRFCRSKLSAAEILEKNGEINRFILSIDEEKRKIFAEMLYGLLCGFGGEDIFGITRDVGGCVQYILRELKNAAPDDELLFREISAGLLNALSSGFIMSLCQIWRVR